MTRLIRSLLFVPGTRPDRFTKALSAGSDAVCFDLEDSVDPVRKAEARAALGQALEAPVPAGVRRYVRINAFGTPWFDADLAAAAALVEDLDGVVVPKVQDPAHVEAVARALRSCDVLPLIETARGVLNAAAIAGANAPIPALLFGAEDLTAQVGIPRTVYGEELVYARSQVVLAATAAGSDAIDAVFTDVAETEDLRRDAIRARALGFRGKMAIHPDQIPIIHEVFNPSVADIARARRIVEAFDRAETTGEGVIRLDNQMIDRPVVTRARRLLDFGDPR